VRVISSTNRDLGAAMAAGTFREDLYYRLNVFHIRVPPLRERREDVFPLAQAFLHRFAQDLGRPPVGLSSAARRALEGYDWPGNVRELQNLMERTAVLCRAPEVEARFLAPLLPRTVEEETAEPEDLRLEPAVEQLERRVILRALGASGDNKPQAARLLGVSERTLLYKLKKYNL
jgi:two-component system, NtrC family, response regulator AtoC